MFHKTPQIQYYDRTLKELRRVKTLKIQKRKSSAMEQEECEIFIDNRHMMVARLSALSIGRLYP
jgi:hypothetical protein